MVSPGKEISLRFAAIAVAVYLMESLIPKPIPWLRLGLANIVVLIALIQYGLRIAFPVALAKVLAGSILTGKILTPYFLLGFGGTLTSLLIMYLFKMFPLSIVGLSVAGSVSHNLTQLFFATFLFIPHQSLVILYPIFSTVGIGTGIVTGVIGLKTLRFISDEKN
ncbi:heptaprenyl diphosphate synthase [candidate division WOR-3 bacterium]|uniref:Heptaprenyl diphosphate synthase n=1 Tax=candidate division WOR-3 bacterium TaxID=2052148 RepID=A0A660SKI9_UNCW3|nr:MAG: heptaprenyl diphosphate synthase [candidate division WOR-3 bacterium]